MNVLCKCLYENNILYDRTSMRKTMTVTDNHITHFDKNNPHLYVKILTTSSIKK